MTDDCGVVCLLDLGCEESGRGEAASLPRDPTPQTPILHGWGWEPTQLSTELTDTFKTLTGIQDVAAAEAGLPRLQRLDCELEAAKATMHELGEAGKAAIKSLVRSSQAKLKMERPG